MKDGFLKVASGTPEIRVADVEFNKNSILRMIADAEAEGVKILCLPELCLTGSSCGDLFLQEPLIKAAKAALSEILERTRETDMLFALGLPFEYGGALYNCAAVCNYGRLLGLVPKRFPSNSGESRPFSPGRRLDRSVPVFISASAPDDDSASSELPAFIGGELRFLCQGVPDLCIGLELGDDLLYLQPPSATHAASGATLILNLSADSETAGRAAFRRELVKGQSARLVCGYIYAGAGEGESTTDSVFAGHGLIAENGALLAESRFRTGLSITELDLGSLAFERRRCGFPPSDGSGVIPFKLSLTKTEISREIPALPFVPSDEAARAERCGEIITIAALGLKRRVVHVGAKKLVLGLSGGLDSTLAALLSAEALDMLGLPRESLLAVTMPGFGTTGRTRGNAEKLAEALSAELRTIPIDAAVRQHFKDIGHDEALCDVVFENAQARERTQILMDIANGCRGLVVGTGNLSELALGWATYNGDHMSMYGVNSGIPKTLVRHLVAHFAGRTENGGLRDVLRDILETPVSPELLPAENGEISQKTEALVGPYELHDFFLYHMIRRGAPPKKVLRMAELAFSGVYEREVILQWLRVFIRRFFSQQFKRSAMPDGPAVGSLSLSPRGGWHMPSDATAVLWLRELEGV